MYYVAMNGVMNLNISSFSSESECIRPSVIAVIFSYIVSL